MTEEKPKTVVFILMHDKAEFDKAWALLPADLNPEGFMMIMEMQKQLKATIEELKTGTVGRLIVVTNGYMVDDRTPMLGEEAVHRCTELLVLVGTHPNTHYINLCSHGRENLEGSLTSEVVRDAVNAVLHPARAVDDNAA